MFEDFKIPQNESDCIHDYNKFTEIADKIKNVLPISVGRNNWQSYNSFETMAKLIQAITTIGMPEGSNNVFVYLINNGNNFINKVKTDDINNYGIMINEEPSTHFRPSDYAGAKFLEGAEEILKQSSQHFLKIFTVPENKRLYVYTNKHLEPPTLYKIAALELSIRNKSLETPNQIGAEFINACIENDNEKARKILNNFFNSEEIIEMEFQKFKKVLINTNEYKIRNFITSIENSRRRIADYENTIAQLATQIRNYNQEIEFLRSIRDDDDHLLFFKHLRKHPYIKSYKADIDYNVIYLNFEAPLIYFNRVPAEKYVNSDYRSEQDKTIVKIILGDKYELWTKCKLAFNTDDFQVTVQHLDRTNYLLNHPHIDRFACFGNHRQAIEESAEAGDYIGAIEQISQAVLNLNFYDGCVIDHMLTAIKTYWSSLVTWKCKETREFLTTEKVVERGDYYEEA